MGGAEQDSIKQMNLQVSAQPGKNQSTMAKFMDLRGAQLTYGRPLPPCGSCYSAGAPNKSVLHWMPSSAEPAEWRSSLVRIARASLLQLTATLFGISTADVASDNAASSEGGAEQDSIKQMKLSSVSSTRQKPRCSS